LPFVFEFIAHLREARLSVPDAYINNQGQRVGQVAGKPAALIHFLNGAGLSDDTITIDHCHQMGGMLARMHVASAGFAGVRTNPMGKNEWRSLLAKAIPETDVIDDALRHAIEITLADYTSLNQASLPRGAVHADVFPDNVFFENGKLSGVIDFYFACTDSFVYDLAIAINAWCFDAGSILNQQKLEAFARGYEAIRPLNIHERAAFKTLRRAAALRILSTRLYDWAFTPAGADVVRKPPLEYALKLESDVTWP
jgi:homoserine kinase type II